MTQSPLSRIKSGDGAKNDYLRASVTIEDSSFDQVLNIQHGRKTARKISSDYVKTIDQIEHKTESSIRSVEFSKTRPSITVSEYQQKNLKLLEQIEDAAKLNAQKSSLRSSGKLLFISSITNNLFCVLKHYLLFIIRIILFIRYN